VRRDARPQNLCMAGPWDPDDEVPDEEWVRPVTRRRPPPPSAHRRPTPPSARRRPTPRTRGPTMPVVPTLVIAAVVVVLAFVLGRVTAGGGDDGSAVNAAALQTTTTTVELLTHTVSPGESLLGIASQYGVTADALAFANELSNQNHVFVGQVLKIPPSAITPISTITSTTRTSG
jgi:LysM repeat protein